MLLTLVEYVLQKHLKVLTVVSVKNLALSAVISVSVSSAEIIEKLYELGVQHVDEANDKLRGIGSRIFVDGRLIGYVEDGQHLSITLRTMRRSGKIHPHVGIYLYSSLNENATKPIIHQL